MKSKIIAIFVLMLIITTALPIVGAINSNKVNEKTFSTNSSNDEYGDLLIGVAIRLNKPSKIWVKDAKVTATHENGAEFNLEYNVDEYGFSGYWLLQGPCGWYSIEAKRGMWSGSNIIECRPGLTTGYIDLKFFKTANVYHELPVLSILRLIFSRLPIFK